MAVATGALAEFYIPCIKFEGYKSNKDFFIGDGATVTLPSTTTIGGSAVVALGDITSSSTTSTAFTVTNSGIFVGTGGVVAITANSATSPTSILLLTANGLTSGVAQLITSSGTLVGAASLLTLTANSATTAAGILRINANALTDGMGAVIASSSTLLTSTGRLFLVNHTGNAGVSTVIAEVKSAAADETIVFQVTASAAITGSVAKVSALATVTGIGLLVSATAATLTTGRYISCNDAATEVFGVGLNGHLISTVSAVPPSCAVTAQHGITAVTITAGSTDTCGVITTTGTQDNATDSTFTLTFGKTYTTAPKSVTLTPANSAGAVGSSLPYISSISATAVVIGITKSASAAATPSWYYQIIA